MGTIYHTHGDQFLAMREKPYKAEVLLQALLGEHPEVLAGEEQDGDGPGWMLVKREAGVADADDAPDRWSLDHLFLDADGIPTLVEVKRSSDTRARREVVAQMLDYAANATAHWKVEQVQAWFEAECDRDHHARPSDVLNRRFYERSCERGTLVKACLPARRRDSTSQAVERSSLKLVRPSA